jgi:hypothetical protein
MVKLYLVPFLANLALPIGLKALFDYYRKYGLKYL